MNKRLALVSILLVTATTVFAAEGAFTWSHFLLGWLEQPLVELGIDPVPMLDLLIVSILLISFAFFAGKPFRKTDMLEPSGRADFSNFAEVIVSGILNFLSGTIRHGVGARPLFHYWELTVYLFCFSILLVWFLASIRLQISLTSQLPLQSLFFL